MQIKQSEDAAARPMVKKRPSPDSDKRTAESDSLSNRPQTTCSGGGATSSSSHCVDGSCIEDDYPPPEPAHPHLSERGLPPSCRRRAFSMRAARSQAAGRRLPGRGPMIHERSSAVLLCVVGVHSQAGKQDTRDGSARIALWPCCSTGAVRQRRHRRNVDCWCRAAPTFGRRRALQRKCYHLPLCPPSLILMVKSTVHRCNGRLDYLQFFTGGVFLHECCTCFLKRCTSGTKLCRRHGESASDCQSIPALCLGYITVYAVEGRASQTRRRQAAQAFRPRHGAGAEPRRRRPPSVWLRSLQ